MDISQLLTLVVAGGIFLKYISKIYKEPILDEKRKSKKIMISEKSNNYREEKLEKENTIDESIIDVTDQAQMIRFEKDDSKSLEKIIQRSNEIKNEMSFRQKNKTQIPYWKHQYIYSHEEIYDASDEQKAFYKEFKDRFLNGEYIDLEGNSNYCFILLFDLFNDYQSHEDLTKLKNHFSNLGRNYPKTAPYAKSLLERQNHIHNPDFNIQDYYLNTPYEYQDYRLGARYKKQLNLTSTEVDYLDKIWNTNNNFLNIEFCLIEAAKLYIAVITELKNLYAQEGKTIEEKFLEIGDLIATKHHKYRKGSQNYKHTVDYSSNYIVFNNIFKHCESTLRQCYGHNRNVDPRLNYKEEIIQTEYELKVASKVKEILNTLSSKISEPNDEAEIALNIQSVNRWKDKFSHIKEIYGNNLPKFLESISALERLNQKTPSLKNLLLEISKFLSKQNKELSLTYYTKYLYYAADSKGIDEKKFVQGLHKSLFKTADQFTDFQKIINDLIKDRDLDKALNATSKVYEIKRKKIELNKSSIQEAKQQHSETVSLLSEYLKEDDLEDVSSQEIQKKSSKEEVAAQDNTSTFSVPFNLTQIALASLFEKNNFSVSRSDLELFARSNNVFESRIIDSINEVCYDLLDDVLIEEEGDLYTINESNFNKILQK